MFPRQVIGGCRRRCLAMLFIALACGSGKDDPRAREQAPRVELDLSAIAPRVELELIKATAERSSGGEVRLDCTATLKNDSGVALRVRTSFFSVFDGIEVLILRESGEKLGRQSSLFHQSPYSVGRELLLKTGETRETLAFPVNLPKDVRSVRVLLVGVLPGLRAGGAALLRGKDRRHPAATGQRPRARTRGRSLDDAWLARSFGMQARGPGRGPQGQRQAMLNQTLSRCCCRSVCEVQKLCCPLCRFVVELATDEK